MYRVIGDTFTGDMNRYVMFMSLSAGKYIDEKSVFMKTILSDMLAAIKNGGIAKFDSIPTFVTSTISIQQVDMLLKDILTDTGVIDEVEVLHQMFPIDDGASAAASAAAFSSSSLSDTIHAVLCAELTLDMSLISVDRSVKTTIAEVYAKIYGKLHAEVRERIHTMRKEVYDAISPFAAKIQDWMTKQRRIAKTSQPSIMLATAFSKASSRTTYHISSSRSDPVRTVYGFDVPQLGGVSFQCRQQ